MNESPARPDQGAAADDHSSALFAHLLMQQTNMALMLMGKIPNPETGQPTKDLETARLFVDMVEMLEAKTKGNLTNEESKLLKQALMTLRMSFVEAAQSGEPAKGTQTKPEPPPSTPSPSPAAPAAPEATTDEGRKKFTKKY